MVEHLSYHTTSRDDRLEVCDSFITPDPVSISELQPAKVSSRLPLSSRRQATLSRARLEGGKS